VELTSQGFLLAFRHCPMSRRLLSAAIRFAACLCTSAPLLADDREAVLASGSAPVLLQESGAGEGPAWHPEWGLLTSGDGHVMRRSRAGEVSVFLENAGSNGLLFDRKGRLVICEPVRRRVSRREHDGSLTVLAERFDGMRFNQPNDLTIDSNGRIYFSDPCYGDRSRMELLDEEGRKVEGVYRIDGDGTVARIITHEADRPNGLLVTPDDKHLFVADNNNNTVGGARKLWRFHLRTDGTVDLSTQTLIRLTLMAAVPYTGRVGTVPKTPCRAATGSRR
jgi:gluconolactonase